MRHVYLLWIHLLLLLAHGSNIGGTQPERTPPPVTTEAPNTTSVKVAPGCEDINVSAICYREDHAGVSDKCNKTDRAVITNLVDLKRAKCAMVDREKGLSRNARFKFSEEILSHYVLRNKTFMGIEVDFDPNEAGNKCLYLDYNNNATHPRYSWILAECDAIHHIGYMEGNGTAWNGTTNNIISESCKYDRPTSVAKCERLLLKTVDGNYSDCGLTSCNESSLVVKSFTDCTQNVSFNYYNVTCPFTSNSGNLKLAVSELSRNATEIQNYMPSRHIHYHENQTRNTLLPPLENTLISISVINNASTVVQTNTIKFSCRLDYRTMFRNNSYDLFFGCTNASLGYLRPTYRYVKHKPVGVFLRDGIDAKFDTTGVECTSRGDTAECVANHTTIFAVLLSVESIEIPASLKLLAVILQSVAVFFLFLTFTILLRVRKKAGGERIPIQINLSISLLFLNFWILLSEVALYNAMFCRAIAVLTHFFLLSSALWMMNEANLLFFRTSKWAAIATKRSKVVTLALLVGWGIPLVITSITAIVGFSRGTYMAENKYWSEATPQYQYCFIAETENMRLAAVIPVSVVLLYNLLMAGRAVAFVHRKRSEGTKYMPYAQDDGGGGVFAEKLANVLHSLKVIFMLLPVLGASWILMIFSNWGSDTIKLHFMYANTVINGLQGPLIFIIYCCIDTKVRKATGKELTSLGQAWLSMHEHEHGEKRATSGREPTASSTGHSGPIQSTE